MLAAAIRRQCAQDKDTLNFYLVVSYKASFLKEILQLKTQSDATVTISLTREQLDQLRGGQSCLVLMSNEDHRAGVNIVTL